MLIKFFANKALLPAGRRHSHDRRQEESQAMLAGDSSADVCIVQASSSRSLSKMTNLIDLNQPKYCSPPIPSVRSARGQEAEFAKCGSSAADFRHSPHTFFQQKSPAVLLALLQRSGPQPAFADFGPIALTKMVRIDCAL